MRFAAPVSLTALGPLQRPCLGHHGNDSEYQQHIGCGSTGNRRSNTPGGRKHNQPVPHRYGFATVRLDGVARSNAIPEYSRRLSGQATSFVVVMPGEYPGEAVLTQLALNAADNSCHQVIQSGSIRWPKKFQISHHWHFARLRLSAIELS